jgi:cysteine desulfurase
MPFPRVYLDHCASSPLKPVVRAALAGALELAGNPSSVHGHGRAVRKALEDARAQVAAPLGVHPDRVVFTSGATEANALALTGFPGRRIAVSAIEHDSVLANAPDAARLPVDGDGVLRLDALKAFLTQGGPALVSVMAVNNETGVIQPVAEVARLVRAAGGMFHVDAVQAAGRMPLSMADMGADLMTLSAHKIGGPAGAGALVLAEDLEPQALLRGGGQERRRRAGTENVIGQIGFAAAMAALDDGENARLRGWRDRLETRIREAVPDARIAGTGAGRVGAISCVVLPGVPGETQVMALDLAGFAVSSGAACSSGKVKPSHVLTAMGEDAATAAQAIRVSLGWPTAAGDVERFAEAWISMAGRLRGGRPA